MTGAAAFRIVAEPGAGLLCRLIGLAAQRDLEVVAMELRPGGANMADIRLELSGLDEQGARIVADKMARIIGVADVRLDGETAAVRSGKECCLG